jgi:hypothetical protein
MKKPIKITRKFETITGVEQTEGIPLEQEIAKILETGSGIEMVTEGMYSDEYIPEHDIRADRFELALEAAIKKEYLTKQIKADKLAKREAEAKEKADKEKETKTAELQAELAKLTKTDKNETVQTSTT